MRQSCHLERLGTIEEAQDGSADTERVAVWSPPWIIRRVNKEMYVLPLNHLIW